MPELGPMIDFENLFLEKGLVKRSKRNIKRVIIHCTDSDFGDFSDINQWHSERKDSNGKPWAGIVFAGKRIYCGYHYIILNGYRDKNSEYDKAIDGLIEKGRPDDFVGAHCEGMNMHSVGIALVGKKEFSKNQFDKLYKLSWRLIATYPNLIFDGHYKFSTKTCPNFNVEDFMKKVYGAAMS